MEHVDEISKISTNDGMQKSISMSIIKEESAKCNEATMTSPVKPRETWTNQLDFIFSLIGYCVGLGNVWRFPYLCYENGGGAFLICYFIAIISIGVPMFFLEISLGQYFRQGAITIWKIAPMFKGIGFGCVVLSTWWSFYVITIFSWALFYLFMSFSYELPWGSCGNWWNTEFCVSDRQAANCYMEGSQKYCYVNGTAYPLSNLTDPVREFWEYRVLQISKGIEYTNSFQWELVISLSVAWLFVYFCIWKGIKWTGKIVYVTSVLPYMLLLVLLIRGATLPGAADGIKYYLTPDLNKLLDVNVWVLAFSQVYYSFGVVFAALILLGSYNRFNNNCYRDSLIILGVGSMTSILAGFVIFSVIGFMAQQQQKPVEEVAAAGTGLAFLVYPTAVLQMPFPQVWAAMFFIMLIIIGIDTSFCNLEGLIASVSDNWPKYLTRSKELTTLVVCVIGFFINLMFVTNSGIYIFELFDHYSASGIPILTLAFCECTVVSWVYGIDRYWDNLEEMLGFRPHVWWKICLKYVTPAMTLIILSFNIANGTRLTYKDYEYPPWAHTLGWILTMSSVSCVPGYACYLFFTTPFKGGIKQKWRTMTEYKPQKENC